MYSFEITVLGDQWFEGIAEILYPAGFFLSEKTFSETETRVSVSYVKKHEPITFIKDQYLETHSLREIVSVGTMNFPDRAKCFSLVFGLNHSYDSVHLSGGSHGCAGCSGGSPRITRSYTNLDILKFDIPDLVQRGRWLTCKEEKDDIVSSVLYGVDFSSFQAKELDYFIKGSL